MSVNIRNPITGDLTNVAGDTINPKSINEMIAPVEDGTASKAYAVGEQFIMNDLLCEATQAIAQGDTMVIGTNCEESEQLSKQVREINDSLTANGNRFEAGYSSANSEYGFNIGSTFYPIGASSGGGSNVVSLLDFDNAVALTTTNYTTPKDGCVIGGIYKGSVNMKVIMNDDTNHPYTFTDGSTRGWAYIPGIPKGTRIKLNDTNASVISFVPYKYQSVDPVINVYNEAEVELDYANPLYVFNDNNMSYTATKDCWLVGTLLGRGNAGENTVTINSNTTFKTRGGSDFIPPTKIKRGDTVTTSIGSMGLYILEGTVSGSVGGIGEVQRSYALFAVSNIINDIDISSLDDTDEITFTVYYASSNTNTGERVSVSNIKQWSAHIIQTTNNVGISCTYANGKIKITASSNYACHYFVNFN